MIKGFFEVAQLVSVCEAQSLSPCTYCLSPPSGLGGNTGLNKRNAEGPEHRPGFNHPASESAPLWAAVDPGVVRHGPSVKSSSPTKDQSLDQSLCPGAWMNCSSQRTLKEGLTAVPQSHAQCIWEASIPQGAGRKRRSGT